MRPVLVSTALVLAAMASPAHADRSRGGRHAKPSAPVSVALSAELSADGTRVVVLDAVVSRDVGVVVLRVGGELARFGATRAGQHRRLAARVTVPADGADVIGSAHVGTGTKIRSRTVALRVGPAAVTKPAPVEIRTVAGKNVAEVRE